MDAQNLPGQFRFREVDQDEKRMRRIFEKFVRNFFARRQRTFAVKSDRMCWFATAEDGSTLDLLPMMNTDVSLPSTDRTIIIECKYTACLYESRFFAERLRASHLYQLSAYLRNLENSGKESDRRAEGILLYPTAGQSLDQSFRLHGHRVRIKTVDLNQAWPVIEEQMLSLIRPQGP